MRRRLLAVAATALLPALGLLGYNEIANRQQRTIEINEQAMLASRLASSEIGRVLEGTRSLLVAVSALPAVADLDAVSCTAVLKRLADNLTMTGAILVMDTSMKLVCDSQGNEAGLDFSERSYVREGLSAPDLVVGEYTVSKLTQNAVLPAAMPLKRDGRVVGVIATGIRLDWLQARVTEWGIAGGSAITIADRKGVILARQPFPERFVGTRIPDAYQYLLTAQQPGTLDAKSQDGTERIIGYYPISSANPLYISAGLAKSEAFAGVNRLTLTSIWTLILSTILAFLAASFVGNRFILKPITRIVGVLEDWKSGNTSSRTHMSESSGELGLVGHSVDRLLDELEQQLAEAEAAEERRNLLSRELGHRIKNTLAIVGAIARQTFNSTDDRFPSFAKRLSALGRAYDLLLENEGNGSDMAAVIRNTLTPYESSDQSRFHIDGPASPVEPEVGLALSLIIHELATNATKYGALRSEGGYVKIAWQNQAGRILLNWREHDGPPVVVPQKEGFGSKLIRRAFPATYTPEVAISYASDGLRFELSFNDIGAKQASDANSKI